MVITEIAVTVAGQVTYLAQYVPAGQGSAAWLTNVVNLLVVDPATQRMVRLPGTDWTCDRADLTSITITRS